MKVAEYRDLIDACWDARTSLVSAATGHEQRCEAMRLRKVVAELKAARCPRSAVKDQTRAVNVVMACEALLAGKDAQFKAADALLTRMAFAAEWR